MLIRNEYLDHGTSGREYLLDWSKFFHGIKLPAFIYVGIDADSGEVRTYRLVDDPVVVPLQARLTATNAIQAVAKKVAYGRPVVESARLHLWYQPKYPGPQTLFWEVTLRNPDARTEDVSHVVARVNAVTGEVVNMAAPASKAPVKASGRKVTESKTKRLLLPKIDLKSAGSTKTPPTVFELAKQKQ